MQQNDNAPNPPDSNREEHQALSLICKITTRNIANTRAMSKLELRICISFMDSRVSVCTEYSRHQAYVLSPEMREIRNYLFLEYPLIDIA